MNLQHFPVESAALGSVATALAGATRPTERADLVGAAYAAHVSVDHRRDIGLYLTPSAVADFMANQIVGNGETVRVLDPAAGAGILLCAAVEALVRRPSAPRHIELVAYEVDRALVGILTAVLNDLRDWTAERGIHVAVNIIPSDFILEHAPALRGMGGSLPHLQPGSNFDVVICNPPYFKLNKADPRAQAAAAVVHGQPNIYGLFMAIGAALLHEDGELIFITPRSYASGPYFRLFRDRFFDCIRPEMVHVFGSRRNTFSRDAVLQENVIIKGIRQDGWACGNTRALMTVSSSVGIGDLAAADRHSMDVGLVLDITSREKVLRLPVSRANDDLMRLVDCWPGTLRAYGLQISTGPVVPFRATEFLEKTGQVPGSHVPLLWMNHVQRMHVTWPLGRHKPEYMKHLMAAHPLLVPNRNYVLLRRFSAKEAERRLVAAPYLAQTSRATMLGLENHLNYVYRPGGTLTEDETFGLAALFNSSLLDTYFRMSNGNTQVSATELRTMPLPEHEIITAIGRQAPAFAHDRDANDELVMDLAARTSSDVKDGRMRKWLSLVESVTSHGPVSPKRIVELEAMFAPLPGGSGVCDCLP
jgi:adenine-specific DNA-methyltransferase